MRSNLSRVNCNSINHTMMYQWRSKKDLHLSMIARAFCWLIINHLVPDYSIYLIAWIFVKSSLELPWWRNRWYSVYRTPAAKGLNRNGFHVEYEYPVKIINKRVKPHFMCARRLDRKARKDTTACKIFLITGL